MSQFSRRIIGALSTALFFTGLTVTTTAITASADPNGVVQEDPNFEKPIVGECRNYGMAAANAATNSSPVVGCAETHTAKVMATPLLPTALTWESDPSAIDLVMQRACYPAFRSLLGRTDNLRHKSAYDYVWFEPTDAQKLAGARWLRCDLVLYGGSTLMPIRRNAVPILQAAPLPKAVTSCLVGAEEKQTVCSKTHRYRATGTWLIDRTYYPGNDVILDIAKRRCPSLVSTPRYWYVRWMSQNAWRAGDHRITCYSRTTS